MRYNIYMEIHKMRDVNVESFLMCKSGNLDTHGSDSNSKLINRGTIMLEIKVGWINCKFSLEAV